MGAGLGIGEGEAWPPVAAPPVRGCVGVGVDAGVCPAAGVGVVAGVPVEVGVDVAVAVGEGVG